MIEIGKEGSDFELTSHLAGKKYSLSQFKRQKNVMLLFYPLDWTPTWSKEVPGVQSILDEFKAADTQVLGVSIDSVYSHENWANSLGGVSFPLLADFHPKGAMAEKYGVYLADKGIIDRATFIIDKQGVVRYAVSVTPTGERNPRVLLAECQKVNKGWREAGTIFL